MDEKLTVLITCKDEEAHIEECIRAIQPVADEILVADSGSTDNTLDIIRGIGGCRIIEREYVDAETSRTGPSPKRLTTGC